jgi:hypothetical protein
VSNYRPHKCSVHAAHLPLLAVQEHPMTGVEEAAIVPCAHHDLPRPIACLCDSLEGIEDEVQDDLLELDAVSTHVGEDRLGVGA